MFAGDFLSVCKSRCPRYVANEGRFKSLWYLYPPDTAIELATATRLVMNWFKPLGYCAVAKFLCAVTQCGHVALHIVELILMDVYDPH